MKILVIDFAHKAEVKDVLVLRKQTKEGSEEEMSVTVTRQSDNEAIGFVVKDEHACKSVSSEIITVESLMKSSSVKETLEESLDGLLATVDGVTEAEFSTGRICHCAICTIEELSYDEDGPRYILGKVNSTMARGLALKDLAKGASEENPLDIKVSIGKGLYGYSAFSKDPGSDNPDEEQEVATLYFSNTELAKEKGYICSEEELVKMGNIGVEIIGVEKRMILFKLTTEEFETTDVVIEESFSLEQSKKRILDEGIFTKETLNERVKYLVNADVSEKHICKCLDMIQKREEEVEKPEKLYVDITKKGEEPIIKRMVRNIINHHNVLLEGPKSVGKNVIWETIGWLLNKPLYVFTQDSQKTKDDYYGFMTTENASKEGISEEGAKALLEALSGKGSEEKEGVASQFLSESVKCMTTSLVMKFEMVSKWLIEGNSILILDEMNLADANTLSGAINSIADDHTKVVNIPGYGQVPIPDSCILGGTQNGLEYMGTRKQNPATCSRFVKIKLNPPKSILNILKSAKTNVSLDILKQTDKVYGELMEASLTGVISQDSLNIRGFIAALQNVYEGQPLADALEEAVFGHCDEDECIVISDMLDRLGIR